LFELLPLPVTWVVLEAGDELGLGQQLLISAVEVLALLVVEVVDWLLPVLIVFEPPVLLEAVLSPVLVLEVLVFEITAVLD